MAAQAVLELVTSPELIAGAAEVGFDIAAAVVEFILEVLADIL